jgi:biopolymer transport protein TolR
MGASLGSQEKGSVNVELNIVPFIDLMSCLTAFLLVTAVWVNLSSLDTEVAGRKRNEGPPDTEPSKVAILIEHDQISVSAYPSGEAVTLGAYDWARLEGALREFNTPGGEDQPRVEVAAASSDAHPIPYRHLVAAMDTAVKVGYAHVGVTEPTSLSR